MDDRLNENLGEHVPRMYRVALRIVGNPDWAEKVVQDTCHGSYGSDYSRRVRPQ